MKNKNLQDLGVCKLLKNISLENDIINKEEPDKNKNTNTKYK